MCVVIGVWCGLVSAVWCMVCCVWHEVFVYVWHEVFVRVRECICTCVYMRVIIYNS